MKNFLRALAFNLFFFGMTTVLCVAGVFVRLGTPERSLRLAQSWARLAIWGARTLCGIRVVVTGLEAVPPGPALIASQHQSAFDTLVWMTLLPAPSYVVKQELTRIPLFGPLLAASGMIPVDRNAGGAALRRLLRAARGARQTGRQLIIFPEGTPRGGRPARDAAARHCRAGCASGPAGVSRGHGFRAAMGPAGIPEAPRHHSHRRRE